MSTSDLIYDKYGTRVSELDEGNESLQRFVFDGTKALAEAKGWELLHGTFERVPDGFWDGDQIYAYLWPVARPACDRCKTTAAASVCCSSHGKHLCHGCYRRTHFVEVCIKDCADCAREGLSLNADAVAPMPRLSTPEMRHNQQEAVSRG